MNKIIENEYGYNAALEEIENLMELDPEPDSEEGKKLHLLVILVKDYEKDLSILSTPDPIEALKFRMEQQNLKQRDLVPLIGSRSKVSEILSGKRPLSLEMIRALSSNLDIPAKVLLKEGKADISDNYTDWEKFPFKEILKRNWISKELTRKLKDAESIVMSFFKELNLVPEFSMFYRKNKNFRSGRTMDNYSLYLWNLRILQLAEKNKTDVKYNKDNLTIQSLSDIVKYSIYDDGPVRAINELSKLGIKVIIESHLPRTYLDGAVFLSDERNPIIGLTLRYDRIDYFWFTLMHELAHIYLHYNKNIDYFFDDLETTDNENVLEMEADEFARDILIPPKDWAISSASRFKLPQAVEYLAKELQIHPAIVAGRVRYESKNYRILNKLIRKNNIRYLFTS